MRPSRFEIVPAKNFEYEGVAHFFRARFRTFEIPLVRDAVVVGMESSASMETLLATLQTITPESLVGVPVNDEIVGGIIIREALLKKFPEGLVERFVLQRVKPYMSAAEILRLDLDMEIVLETSV